MRWPVVPWGKIADAVRAGLAAWKAGKVLRVPDAEREVARHRGEVSPDPPADAPHVEKPDVI